MLPTIKIGRHEFVITTVASVTRRTGFRGWLRPGYDALLTNGRTLHFTEEEKIEFDNQRELHQLTMQVYGMARAAGARGL